MNVRLAAQTLSSSVANAIEFLDKSFKLPALPNSNGTIQFISTIDKLFDMLNSRNPLGNGYKTPVKLDNKSVWEEIFTSSAHYLLSLKTKATPPQFLSTTQRKTFIIGFVACVKSTICMATEMVSAPTNHFKYLLTYKFSQDHIQLLFSCIRSKGGWNNNPNCLQMKYALRKMLMRNAITTSTSQDVIQSFPCFISENTTRKLRAKLKKRPQNKTIPLFMLQNLDQEQHSEFVSNVLYYITGYIISQIINRTSMPIM